MKNLARLPALRSVPVPVSVPITCGYHEPPSKIFAGTLQRDGSDRVG